MIDPSNSNSVGLNPFVYDDPLKIAVTISSALKAMYGADDNAIEKFRAYYSDFFCKRTDIFERIDPDNLEMITTE